MSAVHRNSDENDELHHLYVIIDKTDNSLFKYGISCGSIKDGLSKRMRVQLRYLNVIDDWQRFFTRIIIFDIEGRVEAKRIESAYIEAYKLKHRQRPRGNLTD